VLSILAIFFRLSILAVHDCSRSLGLPKRYAYCSCDTSNWYTYGTGFCRMKRLVAKLRDLFPCPGGW